MQHHSVLVVLVIQHLLGHGMFNQDIILKNNTIINFIVSNLNVLVSAITWNYITYYTFPGGIATLQHGIKIEFFLTDVGDTVFENNIAFLVSQIGTFVTWTIPISWD